MLLLAACSKPTSTSLSTKVTSIASLRDIATDYRSILIRDNLVVEGQITANDKYGEFYNTLIVDDGSAAIKIMCEFDNNEIEYPFGSRIKLYCSGLYLFYQYGSLSIGAEPTGEYTLDYISEKRVGQYLKHSDEATPTEVSPLQLNIAELTPLHSNRYVELSNIMIVDTLGVTTFCARDPDTGRTLNTLHQAVDKHGDTIELFVNRLCSYADASLPKERCKLQVIVDYFDGDYSATITNCAY